MKIKYSDRKITFKISRDELEALTQEQEIYCDFIFPSKQQVTHKLCQTTAADMNIDFNSLLNVVTLQVSADVLQSLKTPSKQGAISHYTYQESEYFFSIEVDLKSKKNENNHAG